VFGFRLTETTGVSQETSQVLFDTPSARPSFFEIDQVYPALQLRLYQQMVVPKRSMGPAMPVK
jgi:hypothetical protein